MCYIIIALQLGASYVIAFSARHASAVSPIFAVMDCAAPLDALLNGPLPWDWAQYKSATAL